MARTPVSYGVTDFFKSFKLRFPRVNLSRKEHTAILACAGDVISQYLLADGDFKMFSRMGVLSVRNIKPKGNKTRMIDFNETRKTGQKVYHFNDHSDGLVAKIVWDRTGGVLADKYMWLFKPVRKLKRSLAKEIKTGKRQYPVQL
jgi:hypothetical protein